MTYEKIKVRIAYQVEDKHSGIRYYFTEEAMEYLAKKAMKDVRYMRDEGVATGVITLRSWVLMYMDISDWTEFFRVELKGYHYQVFGLPDEYEALGYKKDGERCYTKVAELKVEKVDMTPLTKYYIGEAGVKV